VEFNLPPKKEVLVYAPLVPKQAEYYKATLERTIFGKNIKVHIPSSFPVIGRFD